MKIAWEISQRLSCFPALSKLNAELSHRIIYAYTWRNLLAEIYVTLSALYSYLWYQGLYLALFAAN